MSERDTDDRLTENLSRYAVRPKQLRPGNRVRLLRGGAEAFPAMLEAIARARISVCLEVYILRADDTGKRFAEALCERAQNGVAVRLLYDAVGSLGLPRSYLRTLEDSGVEVLEYHPIAPWRALARRRKTAGRIRGMFSRRDHRKILIVDHRIGFTGGINISDDYIPESQGGGDWFDMHCEVRGPIVNDLERLFRRVWVREGGRLFTVPKDVPKGTESALTVGVGGCRARIIDNRKYRQRRKIQRAYLHAINRARSRIYIMNAYFLPDPGMCRALRRAARRGVRVCVLVPGRSDVTVFMYASEYIFGSLLSGGVEIFVWPDKMMHAKIAVIDSTWSAIGSYNLDDRSLRYNLEVLVEILDDQFGTHMNAEFEDHSQRCTLMTLETWRRRPWTKRLLSWFFYRFRRWM